VPLTIRQIAALALVSRSTVSRVLNDHPGVQASVRDHVLQVMREHNYAPHAAARSLANSRTDTIGLVIPGSAAVILSDPFISTMIHTMIEVGARQGYVVMVALVTADMEPGFYDRILRGRHFDGIVMFSSDIDDPILPLLIKDHGPLVLIGSHPYFHEVASVDVGNREGARDAVAHLIGLGHRRIGLISGPLQMESAQARRDGYKQALLEAGIAILPELMVAGDYSQDLAYQAMTHLLDLPQRPTAVFASSDSMAVGALHAIRNRGLRVAEDIGLIGFDDLPFAAQTNPPLTSVSQPVLEMATCAVKLLIEQIRDRSSVTSIRLPAQLVIRESSGPSIRHPAWKGGTTPPRTAHGAAI
jgi:LacI family transcriptional regulator, galactose operon repressor